MLAKGFIAYLLLLVLSSFAHAGQLGRTTQDVNLRQGPSLSAPRIERLKAGTEVEVVNRDHPGWYFVLHQRRPGFVYERYVQIEERREAAAQVHSNTNKLVMLALAAVIAIVVILLFARFRPWKTAFACAGFFAVLNIGFKLDALYSLVLAWLVVVGVALCLTRKINRQTSSNERAAKLKKAA